MPTSQVILGSNRFRWEKEWRQPALRTDLLQGLCERHAVKAFRVTV